MSAGTRRITMNAKVARELLYAAFCAFLAFQFGCGGGSDSTPVTPTIIGTFSRTPDTPPGPQSVTMQPGASGNIFSVKIQVTSVNDFFGTGFSVDYENVVPGTGGGVLANLQFVGADFSGSFLTDPSGTIQTKYLFVENPPGTIAITATRVQVDESAPNFPVPGVNVGTTPLDLVTLSFRAQRAMTASPITFAGQTVVCTSQVAGAPPTCVPATIATWAGGTVSAQ